jgi:hypothetical protein
MNPKDPYVVACSKCRQEVEKETGWLKDQTTLTCTGCGADMADELVEAKLAIGEAEKIAADDYRRINRGES